MTLTAGTRLGPYEIAAPLGAGGMGEVYRARDTRLGREVAIKVLPAEVAKDRDRVSRFEQEARAASALNHPNIVTVYDVGRSDDTVYIAMELVDGQTLGKLTAVGPMPIRRLLGIATQVAEGLAKAHSAGIVHRDLKPENVMVSSDGFVKILDFGLAKLVADPADVHSALPTQGPPQTHPGTVLGTVGYMSPEQAAGLPLDFRTDQFSFGSMLYEMATGKRAFLRGTTVDTLAAILHEEPDAIARVTPAVPAPLRWIAERCLEKDPRSRYASTVDLARELGSVRDHVSELSGGASVLSSETRHRSRGRLLAAGLAVASLILGVVGGFLLWGRVPSPAPTRPMLLNIALAPGEELALGYPDLAISPDGSRIVYGGRSGSGTALYVRPLDSLDARRIPGTEGALNPFFSPDGSWIGFGAEGKLKKVSLAGGQPQTLCDAPVLRGGSWGRNGTILFAPGATTGLFLVAEGGGEPRVVTRLDAAKGERTHRWPHILDGGETAIFTISDISGTYERARIEAVTLASGQRKTILEGATFAQPLGRKHLLFMRGDSLFAVRFDARGQRVADSPVPVLDGVEGSQAAGFVQATLSATGSLVYLPSNPLVFERDLVWIDRKGGIRPAASARQAYGSPRLSRDGRRLAASIGVRTSDIWIYEIARDAWEQLTKGSMCNSAIWSPDGKQVAFASNREGTYNIFVAPTDRSVPPRQLTKSDRWTFPVSWAPDGRTLLAVQNVGGNNSNIVMVPLDNPDGAKTIAPAAAEGRISPDGSWFVYESGESGRPEVYLSRYPTPAGRIQVSTDGGTQPAWSPDGREVFFCSGDRLMAAPIQLGSEPRAGLPRVLLEGEFAEFDPAPDGQSFLVVRRAHPNLPQKPLAVALGFADLVAARVAEEK